MRLVREHLRRGVAAWLACHALTFTALLPRDCCAAHAHVTARADVARPGHTAHAAPASQAHDEPPCHEAATATPTAQAPGDHCEMAAHDGAACPMHSSNSAAPLGCAMIGVCGAPDAMLQAVLMQPAVPVSVFAFAPHLLPDVLPLGSAPSPRSLASPPDAPPPRA